MTVPYGTLYIDQSGNINLNGGKIIDTQGRDVAPYVNVLADSTEIETATAAEINTGTDAAKVVTPDALAGSNVGAKAIQLQCFARATNCATGDGAADFIVPAVMNGMNIVAVQADVKTAGTTNTMDIQINNSRTGDVLSTKITIDSTEVSTLTAATAAVIDTTKDDLATGDQLRIDVDAVHSTPAKGLWVTITAQLP